MALRLIEIILEEKVSREVLALMSEHKILESKQVLLPHGEVLLRILLDAEKTETVLDLLEKQKAVREDNRVIILPVAATVPLIKPEPPTTPEHPKPEEKLPERIGREELYEGIKDVARFSRIFLVMTILSTIVAAAGLYQNNFAIIIGAMMISPIIGPNIAMALSTTLGDVLLLRQALRTSLSWIATVIILSVIFGAFVPLNPEFTEVASRTQVGLATIAVALASGCAGALAFTTAVPASLIGVMLAVALLPPLVIFGMLLGGGYVALAMGALFLFLMNLVCVNLAGVITFLFQGIRPFTWWEKHRAKKATRVAIGLWVLMLLILVGLIFLSQNATI